jgi:hypothetical protein
MVKAKVELWLILSLADLELSWFGFWNKCFTLGNLVPKFNIGKILKSHKTAMIWF